MRYHQGIELQRGRGFGSLFSGLIRSFMPIARAGLRAGKRVLESDFGRNLKEQAIGIGKESVKNVLGNVIKGESLSKSLSDELEVAKKKIGEAVKGSGKRKRKPRLLLKKAKQLRFNLLE